MELRFQYTPEKEQGGGPIPYLDVVMRGPRNSDRIENCLVDSGADHNFFNMSWAQKLGIDVTNADTFKVPQRGNVEGRLVPVKYVLDENFEWVGETVFIETEEPTAILGMIGFFDAFDVRFSHNDAAFFLAPTNATQTDLLK